MLRLNKGGGKANHFSTMASLMAEPARANMLWKLLEGKALTATELAISADVSAPNASMHLAKLMNADLVAVVRQGRHRYYRLSKPEVAYVLESIAHLVPLDKSITREPENGTHHDFKYCRTCYDHLAGKVGVAVTDKLIEKKIIISTDNGFDTTPTGIKWLAQLNISVADLKKQRRVFARKCLDWSERRYHVSGLLGAALTDKMIAMKWIRKVKNSRKVFITSHGQNKMYELLGLRL